MFTMFNIYNFFRFMIKKLIFEKAKTFQLEVLKLTHTVIDYV